MIFRGLLLLFAFSFVGCAHYGDRGVRFASQEEYTLNILEDSLNKRFEITIVSNTTVPLCLVSGDWPNQNGYLNFGSDIVFVVVGGRRYPIKARNLGYGPGGTYIKIRPRGFRKTFIPFSEFDAQAFLDKAEERQLIYNIRPFYCPRP